MSVAPRSTRRPRAGTDGGDAQDVGDGHDVVDGRDVGPDSGANRRSADRVDVTWSVDCETEDTFLYASIANISAMGIFVRTEAPLAVGTEVSLRFAPSWAASGSPRDGGRPAARDPGPTQRDPGDDALVLRGRVQWVNPVRPGGDNPNPGMGIRFIDLDLPTRELLVEAVRSIAYLREDVAVGD